MDASVRCRCFEEGKLKPGPVPVEDLYIDEEGYLSSRKLDEAYRKYDHRRFMARYGRLRDAFDEWMENCCEHEDGDACCEWVSNWAGCAMFNDIVEELGGPERFPLLSGLLPDANGGFYPAEKAGDTLEELNRLLEAIAEAESGMPEGTGLSWRGDSLFYEGKYWTAERIRNLLAASVETGNPIRWC